MPKGTPVHSLHDRSRMKKILPALWNDGELSIQVIAARFGVSKRTVVQVAEELGLPRERPKGIRYSEKYIKPKVPKLQESLKGLKGGQANKIKFGSTVSLPQINLGRPPEYYD